MSVGRVKTITALRTGDPDIDRNLDLLRQTLNPALGATVLNTPDFRWLEVQPSTPSGTPTFSLQYRSSGTTWTTIATFSSSGQITQPAWTTPTFTNSWANFGSGTQVAGFMKGLDGWVHLRGTISSGTLNTAAFVLPAGFRPAATRGFTGLSNGAFGQLNVDSSGNVIPVSGSNANFSLDQAHFDTRS